MLPCLLSWRWIRCRTQATWARWPAPCTLWAERGWLLPRHNSAYLGPGARRSAAGALERLPLAEVVNLARAVEQAREAGFSTYAARFAEDGMNALSAPLEFPALLSVLGNEDGGCGREWRSSAPTACMFPFCATLTP